jgi:ketopantoate reductase
MRTLILGAGVIGSFNAAHLAQAGQDVTLLARGQRFSDLRQYGVVLEHYRSGRRTTTQVPLVDRLGPEDAYDLAILPFAEIRFLLSFRSWRRTTSSQASCSSATTRPAHKR